METVQAKHLLTPLRPDMDRWFFSHYNMNLYHGCCHGCIYCDSRSLCYHIDRFDTVRPKANALEILAKELAGKRRAGIVSTGALSDPYNPLEAQLCLTRDAFALLHRHGFGVDFTTKSALCARDAALLAEIGRYAPVCARLSVTCAEDDLSRRVEPNVSPTSARFAAIRTLADAGVYAGVWLNPMLPFIADSEDNMVAILRRARDAGARFAVCFFTLTLRSGNREYFFSALERDFPGVRDLYLTTYGNAYECVVPNADKLYKTFTDECARLGLACRFRDVNEGLLARQPKQESMF